MIKKNKAPRSIDPRDVGINNNYVFEAIAHPTRRCIFTLNFDNKSRDWTKYTHNEVHNCRLLKIELDLNCPVKTIKFMSRNGEYTQSTMEFNKRVDNVLFGKDSRTKRDVRCTLVGVTNEKVICALKEIKLWISPRTDDNQGCFWL